MKDADDIVEIYKTQIGRFPRLSVDEERELTQKIHAGDRAALQRMVNCNLRLVFTIASKYLTAIKQFSGISFEDVIQDGNIGLIRAAERFSADTGHRFSSYATPVIKGDIARGIKNRGRSIRLPERVVNLAMQYKRTVEHLTQTHHRRPSMEEIAAFMGISVNYARDLQNYFYGNQEVDATTYDEMGTPYNLLDTVPDENSPDIGDEITDRYRRGDLMSAVMGKLTEREQLMLRERIGDNADGNAKTLSEIGEIVGLTKERVRQCEVKIREKLRRIDIGKMGYDITQ